jgi:hypothetical protein
MTTAQKVTKKGQFNSLEEAVAFKNERLMQVLKDVDLKNISLVDKKKRVS